MVFPTKCSVLIDGNCHFLDDRYTLSSNRLVVIYVYVYVYACVCGYGFVVIHSVTREDLSGVTKKKRGGPPSEFILLKQMKI